MKTKEHQITLNLSSGTLELLKAKAAEAGKPVELFISDILNKMKHQVLQETLPEKELSK